MNDIACMVVVVVVEVQLLSGKSLSLKLGSDVVTVWNVKGLVKRAIGVPRRQQHLFNDTRKLTNHSAFNDLAGMRQLTLVIVQDRCQFCADETHSSRVCGGCRITPYCSEACQRYDWRRHKATCVPPWIGL